MFRDNPPEISSIPINENQLSTQESKPKKLFSKIILILMILVLIAAGAFTYFYVKTYSNINSQLDQITHPNQIIPSPTIQINNNVACTMEAKQCPDGSYVSRTGPQCEFAACPK